MDYLDNKLKIKKSFWFDSLSSFDWLKSSANQEGGTNLKTRLGMDSSLIHKQTITTHWFQLKTSYFSTEHCLIKRFTTRLYSGLIHMQL